jgi:hypothetical protein
MWFLFGGGAAADIIGGSDSRRDLAASLGRARDPRAVSALALAARDGDEDTSRVASAGLEEILPTLKASDAPYISPEGMDALIALVKRGNLRLGLSILAAFKQVGDSRALPVVEELAKEKNEVGAILTGELARPSVFWQSLQEGARECLPYLRALVEEEKARTTLLRAAQATDTGVSLLRPANGVVDSDEQVLLRAVEVDDGNSYEHQSAAREGERGGNLMEEEPGREDRDEGNEVQEARRA